MNGDIQEIIDACIAADQAAKLAKMNEQLERDISDLTEWVSMQTEGKRYDAIIGHSLGGLIALELAAAYSLPCSRIICLDTNLKPAGTFSAI